MRLRSIQVITEAPRGGVARVRVWTAFVTLLVIPVVCVDPASSQEPKPGSKADITAIGNRKIARGPNFYTVEREIALGKKLADEIDRSARFIDDPVVVEYVTRVSQNLVRDSDAQVPFTIKVVDSDEINAFSLPGGFLYVNSGLILFADEESALAGVIAHEIAHVSARHSTRMETESRIAQVVAIPLILVGPAGWAGYAIYSGVRLGLPLTMMKFSRAAEAEADYFGMQYMYKAGYDPNAVVLFLEKIAGDGKPPGMTARLFSNHPAMKSRIKAAQDEMAAILPPRDEYIVTTSEFENVKQRLLSNRAEQERAHDTSDGPVLHDRSDRGNPEPPQ